MPSEETKAKTTEWVSIGEAFSLFCNHTWIDKATGVKGERTLTLRSGSPTDNSLGKVSDSYAELAGLCSSGRVMAQGRIGGFLGPVVEFTARDWQHLRPDYEGEVFWMADSRIRMSGSGGRFADGTVFFNCLFKKAPGPDPLSREEKSVVAFDGADATSIKDEIKAALKTIDMEKLEMTVTSIVLAGIAAEKANETRVASGVGARDYNLTSVSTNYVDRPWQSFLRNKEIKLAYDALKNPGSAALSPNMTFDQLKSVVVGRANSDRRSRKQNARLKYLDEDLAEVRSSWEADKATLT